MTCDPRDILFTPDAAEACADGGDCRKRQLTVRACDATLAYDLLESERPNDNQLGPTAMSSLIAASAFFLLIHFGVSGTRLRDALVARMGAGPYRGAFALASLAGIVWMGMAYSRAPTVELWGQLAGGRPVVFALVFLAFLFIGIGLATPSPTRVGMESKLAQGADVARGIVRVTRHPFLWGVALWALVHLVVNGNLASLILFGSLFVLALGGTASIDAKRRRNFGDDWARFAQATSSVPFAAIASGRNQLGAALREIGLLRPLIGIAVYALLFYFHGRLFGVALMG